MKNEIKYEDALKRLEEIVDTLNKNEVSLDDALKLYEEGIQLTALCNKKLNDAKQKIIEIEKE